MPTQARTALAVLVASLAGCDAPPAGVCGFETDRDAARRAPPPGTWQVEQIAGAEDVVFRQGWAAPTGALWAIGYHANATNPADRSAVAYFDRTSWRLLDLGPVTDVTSGWASGPDDVWLATRTYADGGYVAAVWRWDGQGWSQTLDATGALWGATPGHPWLAREGDAVLRFDGERWVVELDVAARFSPPHAKRPAQAFLDAICGGADDDVVVSGEVEPPRDTEYQPMLWRWDGVRWIDEPTGEVGVVRATSCGGGELWGVRGGDLAYRSAAGWRLSSPDAFDVADFPPPEAGGFEESHGLSAPLARAASDVWVVVERAAGDPEGLSWRRQELWHHDGCAPSRVSSAPDAGPALAPRIVLGSGDDVWLLGDGARVARFRPAGGG